MSSYVQQSWADGEAGGTPITAARLAHIEQGVKATDTEIAAHEADTTAAHAASAISFTPAGSVSATSVQAAVAEVSGDADTALANVAAHIGDATDAHDASAISFTPTGTIGATDVQAAIAEVAAEAAGGGGGSTTAIWQPDTSYVAGQLAVHDGAAYTSKADHISGTTFNPSNWDMVSPALLASAELTANYAVTTDGTFQLVPGLSITPPSVNRPVLLELSGAGMQHTAAQGSAMFTVSIYDVTASTAVAVSVIDYPTANRWSNSPYCRALLPAGAASHTYQMAVVANAAGTATVKTSGGIGWILSATQV